MLSARGATRVVAIQRPVSRLGGQLLMLEPVAQVVAVRDAMTVGDYERRPGIRLGFHDGLQRLRIFGAHRDLGDIDMAIRHRHEAQVFLRAGFSGRCEFRGGGGGCRLRLLPAGVRVHLGVEHEHVHVGPARQHVIEAAIADVVRPPVAADNPDAFLHQVVGEPQQLGGGRQFRQTLLQQRDVPALCLNTRLMSTDLSTTASPPGLPAARP